ncbi:MAG: citrate synthase [Verrucomicrobia bacterium RIFCSPHIGHO2_12_FULL_41_10]|nr:MAG: citrate synthase [Verrucomicrobia bacterium RIFCSPHIGHO2_12_FULL_41_10]HLB34822.1 citrate/2-methylcitrate synthase [Chthoniobacterales bacterium]
MPIIAKGLKGIIANTTSLSDVRGAEGILVYAGYNIDELIGKVSYEEVVHLLWYGELPTAVQLVQLHEELANQRELPQGVLNFILSAPRDANPMDVIRTGVSMLGLYDHEPSGNQNQAELLRANRHRALSITAKVGVIAAYYHRARQGKDLPPIDKNLTEAEHFLYLLNGEMPTKEAAETLDVAYVLHADHGMNASTFSARVTIATLTDLYSAITSAIGTLKGPLHGGANEAVIYMLQEIGDESRVDDWVNNALEQKKKIMGIGHAVYQTLDPRAPHLRTMAITLCERLGETKWIRIAERISLLMKEKKGLNANVDFYSAIVYYALGLPTDMFTPIFSIARTAGWTAHVLEQLSDNNLYRPLSEYVGPVEGKKVIPISQR